MDADVLSKKQDLLNAIQAFSPSHIYLLAPADYVRRGYEYYRTGSVLSFSWSKDHACLTAMVQGTQIYAVNLLKNRDRLRFSCSCPAWSEGTQCKHVICSLFTVKNLLQPELFKVPNNKTDRRRLLTYLIDVSPDKTDRSLRTKEAKYAIVIEKMYDFPIISVSFKGKALPHLGLCPQELVSFATSAPPYLRRHQMYELINFLTRHRDRYPLVVRINGNDMEAFFDPELHYDAVVRFDIAGQNVNIEQLCSKSGEIVNGIHILGDMAFDPSAGSLGLIKDKTAWEQIEGAFNMMPEIYSEEWISMPLEDFNRQLQIMRPRNEADGDGQFHFFVFTVNNKEFEAARIEPEYRVVIEAATRNDSMFVLMPQCRVGGAAITLHPMAFDFFSRINSLSSFCRAKKRKDILFRAFFELISAANKKSTKKIITAAVKEAKFPTRRSRSEAVSLMTQCAELMRLEVDQIFILGKAWAAAAIDTKRRAGIYRTLYELFGRRMLDATGLPEFLLVTSSELASVLAELRERLANQGIGLYMHGKPVREAEWDIEVSASSAGIDWFELRPEIKSDGRLLDPKSCSKGYVELDDCIEVLNSNMQALISGIASLTASGAEQRPRKIVRIPRLMILDWMSLRSKGVKIKLPPEDQKIIDRLLNFERIERRPLPQGLEAVLRPYQRDGYDWLAFLYEHRFGACLADDMGLGKTLQAISLLAGIEEGLIASPLKDEKRPHLIVVPPSLVFNWEHEIARFYPVFKVKTYIGTARTLDAEEANIILTTYGIVRRDIEKLEKMKFDVIVFDEAQTIKNIHAGMTSASRKLNAYFKLVMTGTPLENNLSEYYSGIDLALPGLFGEYDDFKALARNDISPAMEMLLRRTRPFVLRRTKEKVLKDLPPKTETDVYLDLTDEQKALYTKTVQEVRGTIDRAYQEKTEAQARIIALTAILRLRQICVSPALIFPGAKQISPKTEFLIESLREISEEGHSALVFSQFTSFLDILGPALEEAGIEYLRLDGSTPLSKRRKIVKDFQFGEGPSVFLLSLKAGGKGLNLTRASYVYHLDPWWNPAVEDQASDRSHRIGQKRSVTITRILMRHTIEEKMMELKKKKVALYKAVMEGAEQKGRGFAITKEDFDYLIA